MSQANPKPETDRVYLPGLPSPPVRATCVDGPRPCPWEKCRHHMKPRRSADWAIRAPSCALDVADLVQAGGVEAPSFKVIGRWFGLSRGRIQQLEAAAQKRTGWLLREIYDDLPEPQGAPRPEDEVVSVLRSSKDWLRLDAIAERTRLSRDSVKAVLRRLRRRGAPVESRTGQGGYRWVA